MGPTVLFLVVDIQYGATATDIENLHATVISANVISNIQPQPRLSESEMTKVKKVNTSAVGVEHASRAKCLGLVLFSDTEP